MRYFANDIQSAVAFDVVVAADDKQKLLDYLCSKNAIVEYQGAVQKGDYTLDLTKFRAKGIITGRTLTPTQIIEGLKKL